MPEQFGGDIMARLQALSEAAGVGGVAVLLVLGAIAALFLFLRGAGFSLLLLLVSYSLIFVQFGGLNVVAFFARALALAFLALSALRGLTSPGWPAMAFFVYAALGVVFSFNAGDVFWSLQNGALLLVTVIALTFGLARYLKGYPQVYRIFHMLVVAGAVWSAISLIFIREFASGGGQRFTAGSMVNATNYAVSGALLFPFMLWAALERGGRLWRLVGVFGVLVIPLCLFLSGTRTAVAVSLIASAPLFLRSGVGRTLRIWVSVAVLGVALLLFGRYLLQDQGTEYLSSRLTSTSLTGRDVLWANGWQVCMESPVLGRGIGANSSIPADRGHRGFHNAYLSIWCNVGLVGLLLLLAALFRQTLMAFVNIRRAADPVGKDAMRLAFGFLMATLAMGMFADSFASPSNATIAMLLMMVTLVNRVERFVAEERSLWPVAPATPARLRPARRFGPGYSGATT